MKSLLSQCGKIKRVETWCLVLKLCLCTKPIIWGSFYGNFKDEILSDEIGTNDSSLKFSMICEKGN